MRGIDLGEEEDDGHEGGAEGEAEDELDGDYVPKKRKDENEMELGIADEDEAFSGESEQDGANGEVDEQEDEDEDEDEEVDRVLQAKRSTKKNTVIGDDDDINVVVVDRSQAPSGSKQDHGSDSEEAEGSEDDGEDGSEDGGEDGGEDDDDGDISDIDEIMNDHVNDDTQGFGAFFEPIIDSNKTKDPGGKKQWHDDAKDQEVSQIQASMRPTPSIISPVTESDPDQIQSSEDRSSSLTGALDLLSGKFSSATPLQSSSSSSSASDPNVIPATADSDLHHLLKDDATLGDISNSLVEQQSAATADMDDEFTNKPKNAFHVLANAMRMNNNQESSALPLSGGLKRLHKKVRPDRARPISKNEKSAFIEYEAEEEEDEFMGMGGADYESDNDQDDYDLADGMVDTTTTLNKQDMENVRQLHMYG
ncbi:hypothetical protein BGZ65_003092 [Modicella reniformis]|uniref:DNA replication checkpoint mediator MRC1 domain-containing protein n=1 Tax=Modicella reniformis TaxID=1440133 RepID=A0A9P6M9E8_9FUNG|nr:hypothetical protein BGZ65_003092 [Modicella reniformis]